MSVAERIKRGFGRLALVAGIVAAIPGGTIGYLFAGPGPPDGYYRLESLKSEVADINRSLESKRSEGDAREKIQKEVIALEIKRREKGELEENKQRRLEELTDRLELFKRRDELKQKVQRIERYREVYGETWFPVPWEVRAVVLTVVGAAMASALIWGVVRTLGWIVAGFF